MKKKSLLQKFGPFVGLISMAVFLSWLTHRVPALEHIFTEPPEGLYLVLALLFALGYGLNKIAPKTPIPSFVWAIFFGMALQPVMRLLTHEISTLQIMVELLAAMVLFGGGVEVPYKSFRKHICPIASMALLGTLLTAFSFSITLEFLGDAFGLLIPAGAFLLMGAILASIDPTAIIPSLRSLKFKKKFLRDFAISESAVNDVVGTILTRFFLVAVLTAASTATVMELFKPIFARDAFDALALEVIWGVIVGVLGALMLRKMARQAEADKKRVLDPALFFAVPIFAFAAGSIVGGSGFLAAFVAGLLFDATSPTTSVRHFFDTFVDKFIKPIIFILLGAVVPIPVLLSTVGIGVVSALIFMFVIRPLVVFISLMPWYTRKKSDFSWRELMFMSFIRETGAIPAVLILVAVGSGVAGSEYIFAIGMWVILLTLIIEPPLTPKMAEWLGVAERIEEE